MADSTQPAQRSSLSLEGRGFYPFEVSPDKGLLQTVNLLARPLDQAELLTNLHFDQIKWTTEGYGYTLHREDPFNGGGAFKEFGIHYLADGNPIFLQQVGTKVQKYDILDNPGTAVEVDLFTAASETYPTFRSFSPKFLIYTNGVNDPQKYDGTTWAALTGFPITIGSDVYQKPKYCENFKGRVAFAGFQDEPYSIFFSKFDDPQNYDVTGSSPARAGVFRVPSQLGPITSLKTTGISTPSNSEILIVGCKKGVVIISGNDANTFQRDVMTDKFGIVNNRCWLRIDDQMWVLASDGIRPINLNTSLSQLLTATASLGVLAAINSRNLTAVDQPFVFDNPRKQEAIWYFPSGAEVRNKRGLIMNYSTLPDFVRFSIKEYGLETSDPATWFGPACGIEYEDRFLCGGYNGLLQKHFSGKLFNGIAPKFVWRSATMQAPTPGQEMGQKDMQIVCEGPPQKFTLKVFEHVRMGDGAINRRQCYTEIVESPPGGAAILGSWILGLNQLGGDRHHRFRVNSPGHGNYFDIELSGDQPDNAISLVGVFDNFIAGGLKQS